MGDVEKFISTWAAELGGGDPTLVLLLAFVAFLLLFIVVVALRTTINRNQEGDKTAAIIARVERLEANLHEFRGEMAQIIQKFREVSDSVREEVKRVQRDIDNKGPGSGGSGGSSPTGGGGGNQGGASGGGGRLASDSSAEASFTVTSTEEQAVVASSVRESIASVQESQGVPTQSVATMEQPSIAAQASHAVVAPAHLEEEKSSISKGLTKTRKSFFGRLKSLFTGSATVTPATLDELEETLITADVGVQCTSAILEKVRAASNESGAVGEEQVQQLVKAELLDSLIQLPASHRLYAPQTGTPLIVLVVGVNGVGKTTTTAKLAARWKGQGKKVLMVAADTFRAAAVQQLQEWGRRLDVRVISGAENAKPSTVVFDGMVAAKEEGADVILIDTAGRLHTKTNLMQELEGVRNAITKHFPSGPDETLLVLDGVSGQNALHQAREFNSAVKLSGVVITKLDGTPKGGIVVAISRELKVPVAYVGVGEKAGDLIPFSAQEFVDGLFGDDDQRAVPTVMPQTLASTSTIVSGLFN